MLNFCKKFSIFCFLDNHGYDFDKSLEWVAGAGSLDQFLAGDGVNFGDVDLFIQSNPDWIFCHVSYDFKNQLEELHSSNPDGIGFPEFLFFIPEIIFIFKLNELSIGVYPGGNPKQIFDEIISFVPEKLIQIKPVIFKSRFTKEEYIETVKKLQAHILQGDCYEINFCQEFYADNNTIDALRVYPNLSKLSPNPFAAFYKYEDKYLMCASPERYLKKIARTIISQPIKGTARRITDNLKEDEQEKISLSSSEKERSENIMIVDMVRNDLSKICSEGSVFVKELLAIYSFPQVHQMISTVSGNLRENITFSEIFKSTFPMGSMTGAPKKRVMELIEKYEKTKRDLFSGTVGYINPEGDFDFNVIIRSILYNSTNKYVSIQAGSAITFKSDAENEYEECLLKIDAMKKSFE